MDIHQSLKAAFTKLKLDFSLMMITCAGVFVVVVISAYVVNFFGWFSSSKEVWGQFGDYVGGVLNPVLSFMALIAVVKSLKYQSEEVKEARSEASAAISMQKEQTKIFKQQSFESVFFGLIDLYSKALETMSLYEEQRVFTGIAVAQRLSFKYNVDRIDWVFNESKGNLTRREREFLFREHANKMLAAAQENGLKFFTILEQLLSYVDGCDLDDAVLKERYVLIIKSLLTPAEVECVLLYGISDDGQRLKELMEQYSLFTNCPKRVGDAHLRNCGLIKW